MTNKMHFEKYQHVTRLGATEVTGIEDGLCLVFPKLDGTNASLWCKDGEIMGGSRNRSLELDNDNHGFYNAMTSDPAIHLFFNDHPTLRLYGEWLVPHTIKTYRDDAWRKFYVFDVIRMCPQPDDQYVTCTDMIPKYLTYDEYAPILEAAGVNYIPCIRKVNFGSKDQFMGIAETNDYLMQPGEIGEGIVIKRYDFVNRYGRKTWAKIVRSEFKEKHVKTMGPPVVQGKTDAERFIVDTYVTKTLVDKERAKIDTEPIQPRLLSSVWHCILTEELADAIKKLKKPTIDFGLLQRYVTVKVKELADDLF